ncbi:hypothetical protein [Actinoplanes sp. NPDC049316]|uniref:hypothetical protein n=1 Tax=Actinoplanes sp. NPDC049316 TaxID=3154727 RepID=UPI003418136B
MSETTARDTAASLEAARAVDAALREAGGGRVAAVRAAYEFGRRVLVVQFVRGSWLCAATVDPETGEVTSIVDEGLPSAPPGTAAVAGPPVTTRLGFRTVWDIRAADDDPGLVYAATDAGVGVVRLRSDIGWTLTVEDHHTTGFGATRQVVPVPGGVVGGTADGRVFRLDAAGRVGWEIRVPAAPHTATADAAGTRVLVATNAGALELDARTGQFLGLFGGPVRAAAYLSNGDRVLAGHRGELLVVTPAGQPRWCLPQGEFPERLWVHDDRVYVAGEGGLKEIVVGEGVVARWSAPAAESVESAVVVDGWVFTCAGGTRLERHGYATAGYHGPVPEAYANPEVIAVARAGDRPWLVAGHRDGLLSARQV